MPEHLSLDEFKSVKSVDSAMSFIFIDATNSSLIDIFTDRRLFKLESYFRTFSKKARNSVKSIICDMYSPYISLANNLFPKSKIIINPFHIIQNFNRTFNITRVKIMKKFNTDSHKYKVLKKRLETSLKT